MKIQTVTLFTIVFAALTGFADPLSNNCHQTRAGTECFVSKKIQCHSGESTLQLSYSYYHVYYYPLAPQEFVKNMQASIEVDIAVYGECMTRNCGPKYYVATASTADAAYKAILPSAGDLVQQVELIHATNAGQNISVTYTDQNNEIEIRSLKIGDQELAAATNFICNQLSSD